jgi:hypothetical protein
MHIAGFKGGQIGFSNGFGDFPNIAHGANGLHG